MNIDQSLLERSGSVCELCGSAEKLQVYAVPPASKDTEKQIIICNKCFDQINGTEPMDGNHWRCLNSSMWSTVPAVQVMAWRILNALKHEVWPQDLLEMLYLDDETLTWAKASTLSKDTDTVTEEKIIHKDSNGAVLEAGDTVVLIKDLDVKGGGFTAKRGTAVRGITLVDDNANQIEGRVNGQHIVILTQFVKKSS